MQSIADKINSGIYFSFEVIQVEDNWTIVPEEDEFYDISDGIYLMPEEPRYINDSGEFMGTSKS